jgi:hypothetical protein
MRTDRCLIVPGITLETFDNEKYIRFEAKAQWSQANVYIECLHEIIRHWDYAFDFIDALIREEIIIQHEDYSLEWTLNKTSLAWLFKKTAGASYWVSDEVDVPIYISHISGGFWNPVETLFKYKRGSLKALLHIKETYGGFSQDIEVLGIALKKINLYIPMPTNCTLSKEVHKKPQKAKEGEYNKK